MVKSKPQKVPKEAKGIFQREGSAHWWLRYTDPKTKKQVRISLETEDYAEAIAKAAKERGIGYYERKPAGVAWADAVKGYLKDKVLGTNNCRRMRQRTADNARFVLLQAAEIMGVTSPQQVRIAHLELFYKYWQTPAPLEVNSRRKQKVYKRIFKKPRVVKEKPPSMRTGSESTARTQTACLQTFLAHIHCLPGRVKFEKDRPLGKKEVTLEQEEVQTLVSSCEREDLLFVLLMGFYQGMRRSEIIAVRPQWISLSKGQITIPATEMQNLAVGPPREWKTKNGKPRSIPLAPAVRAFFEKRPELLDPNRLFVLHPESASKGYRWDPRKPFEALVQRIPKKISMHTMRHTWISHLANHGAFSVGQISAWSGDTLQVIETNYFHGRAPAGALDAAFETASDRAVKSAANAEEMALLTLNAQEGVRRNKQRASDLSDIEVRRLEGIELKQKGFDRHSIAGAKVNLNRMIHAYNREYQDLFTSPDEVLPLVELEREDDAALSVNVSKLSRRRSLDLS
ncbi:MAG: site-specific integrase [Verrucomicrobiota bacterium]